MDPLLALRLVALRHWSSHQLLALIHDWHIHVLVEVLGLWDLNCFLYLWIVGTCQCVYKHVHDLLGSPLSHSFPQRLDLLLSDCCGIGMCAVGVHAVWLQLVKVLSESAFVWIKGSHQHQDRTS